MLSLHETPFTKCKNSKKLIEKVKADEQLSRTGYSQLDAANWALNNRCFDYFRGNYERPFQSRSLMYHNHVSAPLSFYSNDLIWSDIKHNKNVNQQAKQLQVVKDKRINKSFLVKAKRIKVS